jgi:hypothetical protein
MYFSADFPTQQGEMKANFSALRQFLLKRFDSVGNNSSLNAQILGFLNNEQFHNTEEYMEMLAMYGNFMDLDAETRAIVAQHFERERKTFPEFSEKFLRFILFLHHSNGITSINDERMSAIVNKAGIDKISDFYRIADKVHSLGYVHQDAIDAVKDFYSSHEGLSVESECLRYLVFNYFKRLINGLTERDYADYFELNKIFGLYMRMFDNQQFNQDMEKVSMAYVDKLMKRYTDKRSRDYQDIKKFVAHTFTEFGFLRDKEVVELFKTRRKRKKIGE